MSRNLPTLVRTPRLVLREWTADDAEALVALVTANIEHLRPWMPWIAHEPVSAADRRALIADWARRRAAGEEVTLGMFLHDGTAIGGAGLHDRGTPNTLGIGYWVAATHTGRGYVTETAEWLTTAGLAVDGVTTIEIGHDPLNVRSAAVPRRLGYRDVSSTRPPRQGREYATGIWAMDAADWPAALHLHPDSDEWIAEVRRSPADHGSLTMLVRRPAAGERELLDEGFLDLQVGLVGDNWSTRGSKSTPDGSADPDAQLNVMNSRAARLVAGSEHRMPLVGDQLLVDLDLSTHNLPPGTRLRIGEAVIEITAKPHTGCAKFTQRFGLAAMRWTNAAESADQRLRGLCAKVVEPGRIRPGDTITKT